MSSDFDPIQIRARELLTERTQTWSKDQLLPSDELLKERERCPHSDVRCSEHNGRRTIACFTCGRLFCNLDADDYAVAYNPHYD